MLVAAACLKVRYTVSLGPSEVSFDSLPSIAPGLLPLSALVGCQGAPNYFLTLFGAKAKEAFAAEAALNTLTKRGSDFSDSPRRHLRENEEEGASISLKNAKAVIKSSGVKIKPRGGLVSIHEGTKVE